MKIYIYAVGNHNEEGVYLCMCASTHAAAYTHISFLSPALLSKRLSLSILVEGVDCLPEAFPAVSYDELARLG